MTSIKEAAQKRAQASPSSQSKDVAKIVRTVRTKEKRWEFSFRFFRQIEKFGLDGKTVPNDWLVSLMERLASLSMEKIENILDNQLHADAYRYHPINWSSKNIPIKREDLNWIADTYRNNPDEYPLEQLMLSKGTGRFVGFFDENWVFNIVLLDPLHNLQPARDFNYEVNDCSPLTCELTQVQLAVSSSIELCQVADCKASKGVRDCLAGSEKGYSETYGVVLIKVDDLRTIGDAKALMAEGKAKDFAEIFEHGLCSLLVHSGDNPQQ